MATLWITVTALVFVGARSQQHRCHVCLSGTGSDVEVERVFPGAKLDLCARSSDVMTCPDNYRGCLTQSKGDQVMRTCAQLAVDACRWANGVEYCYCMGDLCNTPPPRAAPPPDDEDIDNQEGSGDHSEPPPPVTRDYSPPTTSVSPPAVTEITTSRGVDAQASWLALCTTVSVMVAVWR